MFRKPHKVKSNTQLKSSEKKKLLNKVQNNFSINDDDLQKIIPSKESVSGIKIITFSQEIVTLYVCQETPLFYEFDNQFHPTVFVLWKCPSLIPHIEVYSGVFQHLFNGADLMIPGIVSNQEHLKEKNIPAGHLVFITTGQNIAALCVGISMIDSIDMVRPGNKGKAVRIVHVFGDELSKMYEMGCKEIPQLRESLFETVDEVALSEDKEDTQDAKENECYDANEDIRRPEPNMTMDEILLYCFTKAVKKYHSELTLPILTNIFYKNYMLEVLPKNMTLDIKKTKYKKLSAFLTVMNDEKIICLEDIKGVQSITSVDSSHEIFKKFTDNFKEDVKEELDSPKVMEIIEKSIINSRMEVICSKFKFKKGDALSDQEVRKVLTEYIKAENLQNPNSKEIVNLNGPLCDILQIKSLQLSWKVLFESILKKMTKCYEIHTPDNQVLTGKGKLPPIELTVTVKTSNKKVTLVKNLELYGINLMEFSKECQHGVAASTTITAIPNSKSSVFQIQGNQKRFIGKLLQEKYMVPKKYIEGLEEQKGKNKK